MRILIHSNGPNTHTGYGVQTALLARRLLADGHEVAVSCTYGLQAGGRMWEGVQLYPAGYEQQSNDVIHNHALHWFKGDPLGGWIIVLTDLWAMVNPLLADFNVVGWCPVDHVPVPAGVLRFFERTDAVPVAMSEFGADQLAQMGLDPTYIPLAVDTSVYKPTDSISIGDRKVTGREIMGVPDDAFVVGMTAMNKDPGDRKGFNEAFRAFGQFWKRHQDAVLYVHADKNGMGTGFSLAELATHAAVPPHAIVFADTYALMNGFSAEMMAAVYTGMDVLLAPSRGEGFCVPLIEAQACGTPVIVNDFSAQPELVGAGWVTGNGHPMWDPAQSASYVAADIPRVVEALDECHETDREALVPKAVQFAKGYDADHVYDTYWRPFLDLLGAEPEPLPLEREPIPYAGGVSVVVPLMRSENLPRLVESFDATNDGSAGLCVVYDAPCADAIRSLSLKVLTVATGKERSTYAEKVNAALAETDQAWLLLVGDDVEFHPGWIEELRKLSDRYDVIGTNDSLPGRVRNPKVADGSHADHFAVRRSYVDTYGASLDGPGILAPDAYSHFFVDREIVELAKARCVWSPCLSAVVEHHHPGYDGGPRDLVYLAAVESSEDDLRTYQSRLPLILQQRRTLGKTR